MAHELTHNFGDRNRWLHVDSSIWPGCGKPKGINPDYPYPTNQIGPNSPDAFWGFDPITSAIITPTGAADFMSYCPARWVSDYTWKNIFSEINLRKAAARSQETPNAPVDLSQSAEILVVSGVITPPANAATFDYGYRLSQDMISAGTLEALQPNPGRTPSPAATYMLELVDAGNAILFSLPFEPLQTSKVLSRVSF